MGTVIVFTAKYIYFPPVTWLFFPQKKRQLIMHKTYSQLTNTYGTVTPIVVVVIERKKSHQAIISPSSFSLPLPVRRVSLPCWGRNYKTNGQLRKGQGQETITCKTKKNKKGTRKIAEKIHRHKNKKRKGRKQRENRTAIKITSPIPNAAAPLLLFPEPSNRFV